MNETKPNPLFALPERMAALPVDRRGYPVPWFVQWIDGVPDFRVMDGFRLAQAVKEKLCWVCGQPFAQLSDDPFAFVIGPMCAINRISSEPPSHRECARYSATTCPFLSLPRAKRRETNLPEVREMAGHGLLRNPGVALVWTTNSYTPFRPTVGADGVLFLMGEPTETEWFACGRRATRTECQESIDAGFPKLLELADEQGTLDAVIRGYNETQAFLPRFTTVGEQPVATASCPRKAAR